MKPDAFLRKIADDNAAHPGTHEVAAPLRGPEHGRWKARHPGMKLPNDLVGFLKRANGLRFHCAPVNPVPTAARLLPLREIQPATTMLFQDQEDEDQALPGTWLALSDDAGGGPILVLDVRKRRYLEVDPEDPEDAREAGEKFEEALDWLFARYLDR